MASGALTSHQVNYLIWRYLQESGHGEAAVMLQQTWNPDPQNLPFAPYIRTHALITLIQKGLQYHELERLIDQDGNLVPSTPASFFGPSTVEGGTPGRAHEPVQAEDSYVARREEEVSMSPKSAVHKDGETDGQITDTPRQPTTKTGVKLGGANDGDIPLETHETAVEIEKPDQAAERSRAVSPVSEPLVVDADGDVGMTAPPIQELPSPVFTLSTGQSIGVQIDPAKAADLAPDTTLVDVPGSDHVTKTCWRPNDPLTLAAAGDTFCGLWKLSGQRSSTTPTYQKLVEDASVTAFDWDATGQMLAVATYNDFVGSITMYNEQGTAVSILPDTPRLVSALRWANRGPHMGIVLYDGQRSSFTLWDHAVRPEEFPPPQGVDGSIYDVAWSDDGHMYACGDGSVYQCLVEDNIEVSKRFTSEDQQETWTLVKTASWAGSPVAAVASTSTANIWIPTHDITVTAAHHADITAIDFRSRSLSALQLDKSSPLTLATSSMDDTVKLWNIDIDSKEVHCTHRLYLGQSSPALFSTFSPDGYAIAAASQHKLFIWHAERGGTPLATWTVPSDDNVKGEPNRDESPTSENSDDLALHRTLSWDIDGKKLALGIGQKMAIVNLQR